MTPARAHSNPVAKSPDTVDTDTTAAILHPLTEYFDIFILNLRNTLWMRRAAI